MKKVYEYSHLGGKQILETEFPEINKQINEAIESIVNLKKTKISKEKTMKGKKLYAPRELNRKFREAFHSRGFAELNKLVLPGAFKQVDFVKGKVLVEVQFGKYTFMFYDLVKFQYFFNESKADVCVEIVPCHNLHKQMSTGTSYGEHLIYDIERLKRNFPSVPVKIILIDI